MQVFPAAIPLAGRKVVVVGHGDMAIAKLRLFATSPAQVAWFAPGLPSEARQPSPVEAQDRWPEAGHFADAALVFLAVDDEARTTHLAAAARAAGALVNVVDRPALSDFQTPAIVDRGDVVASISTEGAAPVLAVDLRMQVEAALPPRIGVLAALARELRPTVKATLPDFADRRGYWLRALRGRPRDLALAGDVAGARREMVRLLNTGEPARGFVSIVGAGPGDPELLTLKAMRALQDAEVIVHDRLVSEAVLAYARRDARRIYVGKTRGDHSVPQREIEAILIAEAKAGRKVVRLKGGDPFVFGRGGEEIEALRAAGVEAEVVPGISAALACAAAAGIPLTHRDHAHAVSFVTGQAKAGDDEVDWSGLSSKDHTLAVYMGVGAAARISERLIAAGRDPQTPVAVVENGTLPSQRILTGTLAELELLLQVHSVDGPAILYIGETASFAVGAGIRSGAQAREAAA